jgi:hypothetical protein
VVPQAEARGNDPGIESGAAAAAESATGRGIDPGIEGIETPGAEIVGIAGIEMVVVAAGMSPVTAEVEAEVEAEAAGRTMTGIEEGGIETEDGRVVIAVTGTTDDK